MRQNSLPLKLQKPYTSLGKPVTFKCQKMINSFRKLISLISRAINFIYFYSDSMCLFLFLGNRVEDI